MCVCVCVCVLKEIYYEKVVHVIVEAEKSHHLLSPSWRPRKPGAVVQSKSSGLRIWGSNGVGGVNPSPRIKEDEMRSPSSLNEVWRKGRQIPPSSFCPIEVLED